MNENLDKKAELKDKFISFSQNNKYKLILLAILILLASISFFSFNIYLKNKNELISEKYIQAGIHIASENKEKSILLFEEIILSKNKFYSILALNTILEKELILSKEKILYFFDIVENLNITDSQKEILLLKKALYLIKNSDTKEGEDILNQIINNDSKLKPIAEQILNN
tara:strand:- start:311 stop:820 length:510 start_codon:yes stop_codon:yes gene_type:complete